MTSNAHLIWLLVVAALEIAWIFAWRKLGFTESAFWIMLIFLPLLFLGVLLP